MRTLFCCATAIALALIFRDHERLALGLVAFIAICIGMAADWSKASPSTTSVTPAPVLRDESWTATSAPAQELRN